MGKSKNTAAKEKAAARPMRFTREQVLDAERYRQDTDLLMALLKPGRAYTLEAVDALLADFKKRRAT